VSKDTSGKRLHYACEGGSENALDVDEILVGAGRAPNVLGLGLEDVGIEFDEHKGVRVDDFLRTTVPGILAVGDVCMGWKFTHAADAAAKIAVQNALFFGRRRLSALVMPWCTYTDPEIAHVGLYAFFNDTATTEIYTYKIPLAQVNRAVCDGEDEGFVKIHVKRGSDRILGATVVAAHAGEMISEITLAIVGKLGLGTLAQVIHPYPTQAEGLKAAANAYMRTKLTPTVAKLFARFLAWRR
jgi:pyruvate/2-oxoglutarate dehydrogenase complex dihydrolipoamide dehydrogenase (E3) component